MGAREVPMGWKGVTIMDQRVRFIAEYMKDYFPFNELCLQFNISRKTGYKWVERYEEEGSKGLADHSRRPHHCPHCTDGKIIEALIRAREKHPTWGPKKLLHILSSQYPDLPAISTVPLGSGLLLSVFLAFPYLPRDDIQGRAR
jgi:putative transposase